jgi:hypothetical protein
VTRDYQQFCKAIREGTIMDNDRIRKIGNKQKLFNVVILWDIAPCSLSVNRHFGGTYHLHLQGGKAVEQEETWLGRILLHGAVSRKMSTLLTTAEKLTCCIRSYCSGFMSCVRRCNCYY